MAHIHFHNLTCKYYHLKDNPVALNTLKQMVDFVLKYDKENHPDNSKLEDSIQYKTLKAEHLLIN